MSDYIEREAVLAYPIRKDKCDRKHANEHFILGIESVIEFVEDLPAADVASVRHGYWEFPIFTDSDDGLDPRVKCSECGSIEAAFARWKYCPNCGAKMDKENEHEA